LSLDIGPLVPFSTLVGPSACPFHAAPGIAV
jgi:hypothetical protein